MGDLEPVEEVQQPGHETVTYVKVTPDMARRIVREHIEGGTPIEEYTLSHYRAK